MFFAIVDTRRYASLGGQTSTVMGAEKHSTYGDITMMRKLLLNWKFMLPLIVILIIAWQGITGFAQSRGLLKFALQGLVEDKTEIVETLESAVDDYERQVDGYLAEIRKLKESNKEQEGVINGLKKKLAEIIVPDNPDDLILDLQRRGIGPVHRRRILR